MGMPSRAVLCPRRSNTLTPVGSSRASRPGRAPMSGSWPGRPVPSSSFVRCLVTGLRGCGFASPSPRPQTSRRSPRATLALNERPRRGDMNWRKRFHAVWEAVMPRHLVVLLCLAALAALLACRERPTQQAQQTASAPPAPAPADISHGEAPVGSSTEPPPVDPAAPPRSVGRLHTVLIEIRHAKITIAPGVTYDAWTFGGQVPGPVIRVTTGDTVDFTLVNRAPMPHSLDFHAVEIAPSTGVRVRAERVLHHDAAGFDTHDRLGEAARP